MTKRIVDINGNVVNVPKHYYEVIELASKMIDSMESENVDRSDMEVIVRSMSSEINFYLCFLPDRTNK